MKEPITRRSFLTKSAGIGFMAGLMPGLPFSWLSLQKTDTSSSLFPVIKKGEKQIFADSVMIGKTKDIERKIHPAEKLEHPVLEADMPWEQGDEYDGKKDRRVYIYGTVLREQDGSFRMWYNRLNNDYYATSPDGLNWKRPVLNQLGENNLIQLYNFHSPSFIRDEWDPDPAKRYKAIGSRKSGVSADELQKLKERFEIVDWYKGKSAYCAAYSADGLNWKMYPEPALIGSDTITLSQDPKTSEYLAFHKRSGDPRVAGRQVFLSVSKDMQNWSEPEPVMVTDETDHQQARLLEGGTHAEIYNMSAFTYAGQWLGVITLFRRTGLPKVSGPGQSSNDGPIDIQLVHSRDGRKWERCSDRSPVIALGPYGYDAGSILGVCNTPVIVGDEMWMYYTAMTTTHGGILPDKVLSIARAAWRIDGMVSLDAGDEPGIIETAIFQSEGKNLFVNANVKNGWLKTEVLDSNGTVIEGYEACEDSILTQDSVKQRVVWKHQKYLPQGTPLCLRFYLKKGSLFSYTIE